MHHGQRNAQHGQEKPGKDAHTVQALWEEDISCPAQEVQQLRLRGLIQDERLRLAEEVNLFLEAQDRKIFYTPSLGLHQTEHMFR